MQHLEITGLSKSYGGRDAIRDVSFEVAEGQVSCLLGPSGCGKSTTLRIIAGVETEDAGDVRIGGTSLSGTPPESRGIGLMFQDFALFPHLRVGDNVAYGIRNKREAGARVTALLKRVGMDRFVDHYPHELSGGEQQRVALVRALAPRPSVILMDEPFSGLDERLRDAVRDETLAVLRDEGAAVLLVTHDPAEAMRMADEIILMREGQVVQRGGPIDLFDRPSDLDVARFFSDVNVISGTCQGGRVDTPFGTFDAQSFGDGVSVDIAIRPQHVSVGSADTPNAVQAHVRRARFLGLYSHVEFDVEGGRPVTAILPGLYTPEPGAAFTLDLPRAHCHVFAKA